VCRDRDNVEQRRLGQVVLDGALIDRAQDRLPVFFWKRRRHGDLDSDAGDAFSRGVPLGRDREREALRVEVAPLAETQRLEARAGSDRGEEEIEGRGGRA